MKRNEGGLVGYDEPIERIGLITLNDLDHLNAMSEDMAFDFKNLISKLSEKHKHLRAIILTGQGRAFSAGGDLKMLEEKTKLDGEENRQRMLDYYSSFLSIRSLGIPLIAAINGPAIGAGLCLACACDIRIASDKAKLGMTFVRLGLHPGMGATYFLPLIMGHARAAEFMLTARVVNAEEALRIGLVSRLVSEQELLNEAQSIAKDIVACGPHAVRQLLETLRMSQLELDKALKREAAIQAINYRSAEFNEGIKAVLEKRSPQFE